MKKLQSDINLKIETMTLPLDENTVIEENKEYVLMVVITGAGETKKGGILTYHAAQTGEFHIEERVIS